MGHQIGWVDEEVCGVTRCNGVWLNPAVGITIYDWVDCPNCGKKLKLRQVNEVVEQGSEPNG